MPPTLKRYSDPVRGFEDMDWNAQFKRHTDFANKQSPQPKHKTYPPGHLNRGPKGHWLISCDEPKDQED